MRPQAWLNGDPRYRSIGTNNGNNLKPKSEDGKFAEFIRNVIVGGGRPLFVDVEG